MRRGEAGACKGTTRMVWGVTRQPLSDQVAAAERAVAAAAASLAALPPAAPAAAPDAAARPRRNAGVACPPFAQLFKLMNDAKETEVEPDPAKFEQMVDAAFDGSTKIDTAYGSNMTALQMACTNGWAGIYFRVQTL